MISKIDKETLNFLGKKRLTFNQFCACLLIYHKDVAGIIKYHNEIGYLTGGTVIRANGVEVNELEDLTNRGFLKYVGKKTETNLLDNYQVTEKFTKDFVGDYKACAKEFWLAYPANMLIDKIEKPYGRNVDYEDFEEKYIKLIKEDTGTHHKALSFIQAKFKTNRYADMNILKFIGSRQWENETNVADKPHNFY